MVFVLSAAVGVIAPARSNFTHSAFEVCRLQGFTSPSQTKAWKRCNVLFGACSDTKVPVYISTGNIAGHFFAEVSRVGPPGQENRSNALRVSLMHSCVCMVSFENFECVRTVPDDP